MCGIVAGVDLPEPLAELAVLALRHRGPDAQDVKTLGRVTFGHARLAIQDLDARSNQPFYRDGSLLTYNGELWNAPELRDELRSLGRAFTTTGDTEVLAVALAEWGVDALARLEGMFAFCWTDGEAMLVARDRFGEVPLHVGRRGDALVVASEVKALLAIGCDPRSIAWVEPGTLIEVTADDEKGGPWYEVSTANRMGLPIEAAALKVGSLIHAGAAERRVGDVPVCTLLSGGIDSAAVALTLRQVRPDVVAYTAVMDPRSPDLKVARIVAEALDVELREVQVPAPGAEDLARVVEVIEQPSKAQVEIGWACLILAQRMQADGFKVTFSGEGSDELWASYGFAYHALKAGADFGEYRKRLFVGQHRKNFARANKVFMAHGVECRLPFLNTRLVEYALRLDRSSVWEGNKQKAVMQRAFEGVLPERVVRRQKLAFQDGMGLKRAIAQTLSDPARFYRAEHQRHFRGAAA